MLGAGAGDLGTLLAKVKKCLLQLEESAFT